MPLDTPRPEGFLECIQLTQGSGTKSPGDVSPDLLLQPVCRLYMIKERYKVLRAKTLLLKRPKKFKEYCQGLANDIMNY